ncbi:hypothetical protein PLESTM_000342200 [Pleodorina starrii]|nr:hypothetical protein PLESTM_000342200 [Pleodorina starrii]
MRQAAAAPAAAAPAAAAAPHGAATRPPWRGPFSRSTPPAPPPQRGPAPGPLVQHTTHPRELCAAGRAAGASRSPPRTTAAARQPTSAGDCGGSDDRRAGDLARALGELAAAAAMSVMAQTGLKPSPEARASAASGGGACQPHRPGAIRRRGASDPGTAAGAGAAARHGTRVASRAAPAEGAALPTVAGECRAASAAAGPPAAAAAGAALSRPRPSSSTCATATVQTARAPHSVSGSGGGRTGNGRPRERPRPGLLGPEPSSNTSAARSTGPAGFSAVGADAADVETGGQHAKSASCCGHRRTGADTEPSKDTAAAHVPGRGGGAGRHQCAAPAHLDPRKGRRGEPGDRSVRCGVAAPASGAEDVITSASAKGHFDAERDQVDREGAVGLAAGAAAAGAAAPAFPALDRVINRRARLLALLTLRRRGVPDEGSSDVLRASMPARAAVAAVDADDETRPTHPSKVGGRLNEASRTASPGRQGVACLGASVAVAAAAAAAAVVAGDGNGTHDRSPNGRGGGGGGRGGQAQLVVSRVNTCLAGSRFTASAATAARGADDVVEAAADAYAAMRAWRARRAAAAATICRAARRYLDSRAAAEEARAGAAAASLAIGAKSRLLTAWRGVCLTRARLRRRYARLAALSTEAPEAGLAHRGPACGDVDLADVDPGLVSTLARLCYAPDATASGWSTAHAPGSNSGLGGEDSGSSAEGGLVRASGWGATAASHRRYCNAAAVEGGRYGLAAAHRRWWLLRAAWCGLALRAVAVAPMPWRNQSA